jgi:superfamily II DNA/RNA helicase
MSVGISINDYIHRCGRTGRGGQTGIAHTFLVKGDEHHIPSLLALLKESGQNITPQLEDLAVRYSTKREKVPFKVKDPDDDEDEDDRYFTTYTV